LTGHSGFGLRAFLLSLTAAEVKRRRGRRARRYSREIHFRCSEASRCRQAARWGDQAASLGLTGGNLP